MKAWVLHGISDIRLETVDRPVPDGKDVLVAVKAVGICGSDIPRIYKTGAYRHPLIPGHEISGIVEELGKETAETWRGRRVGIFPLLPCGICRPCKNKQFEMCRDYDYIGSRRNGGFAEYVAVPAGNLLELPDNVSYEEAAMLEPMAVAVHAMRRAALSASDTVAICGLGTIGLLLLMFLLEADNTEKIFVIGNKDSQHRTVINMGLPEECYCDGSKQPAGKWLMERTEGKGVDVFFECVGKNETFAQAVDNASPAGRVILTGNPYSAMRLEKSVYWKILRNQLTVTGTWNSSFTHDRKDDWHYVLDRLSEKRIAPAGLISHKFTLESLEEGMRIMRDKSEDYVKIMGISDAG